MPLIESPTGFVQVLQEPTRRLLNDTIAHHLHCPIAAAVHLVVFLIPLSALSGLTCCGLGSHNRSPQQMYTTIKGYMTLPQCCCSRLESHWRMLHCVP